jgi:PhoH-like ATPase
MSGNKYGDIRWKWLEEKGFNVLGDKNQYAYMQALWTSPDIVRSVWVNSPAGTGKTQLAVLAGAYEIEKETYDKIIYLRNAVAIRDPGALPGYEGDKDRPYLRPFLECLDKVQPGLYEKWSITEHNKNPKVYAMTTSFERGVTYDNAFVIVDEAQSWDLNELQTIYTRCTDNCKIVTIGSTLQIDNKKLKRVAGLTPFEVYMKHFKGNNAAFIKLETNYRGNFSLMADKIGETVKELQNT